MSGEPSRVNGKLGGRPRGALPREIYAARKKARQSLQELCQKNEAKYVAELERIALEGFSEAARISAIGMLLDRGHGRPTQEHNVAAASQNQIIVITGVPEPDPEPSHAVIEHDNLVGDEHVDCDKLSQLDVVGMASGINCGKSKAVVETSLVTRHNPNPWKR